MDKDTRVILIGAVFTTIFATRLVYNLKKQKKATESLNRISDMLEEFNNDLKTDIEFANIVKDF